MNTTPMRACVLLILGLVFAVPVFAVFQGPPDLPQIQEMHPETWVSRLAPDLLPTTVLIRAHNEFRAWLGSGMILSASGQILTNNHVVEGADIVTVTLWPGETEILARVERTDPGEDLALVQLESVPEGLIPALLAGYDPVVGQDALVIGAPRGLSWSVTRGIVSAVDRDIFVSFRSIKMLLQLDAPVNPGNSGGPVFDSRGRVIGLICAGYSNSDGLSFAVCLKTIRRFLASG